MTIQIDIAKQAGDWPSNFDVDALVEQASMQTMAHLGFADIEAELSVLLTDDAAIGVLNAQWRNIDKPTNVLSFPALDIEAGQKPAPMLGDIVLAYETIAREASDEGTTFADHFSHLIVHGLLHLLGYDHEIDDEAEKMEALERQILERMGVDDPYALEHSDS